MITPFISSAGNHTRSGNAVLSKDTKMCSVTCGDEDEEGVPGDVARFGEHAVNKHKTTTLEQRMKIVVHRPSHVQRGEY